MSIHKFSYSAGSLQEDKIENLEKEFESQTKLINIKLNDVRSTISGIQQSWHCMQSTIDGVSDKLEKFNTQSAFGNLQSTELQTEGTECTSRAWRIEEIQFINDETQIVVNAKLFLDINKSMEDIKVNLKYLE